MCAIKSASSMVCLSPGVVRSCNRVAARNARRGGSRPVYLPFAGAGSRANCGRGPQQRRDPLRHSGRALGDRRDRARFGHRVSRRHDRERRAARDRPRAEDRCRGPAMDGRRLSGAAHRVAVVRRRARRPLRPPARVRDRARVVHGRERRLCRRARRDCARHRPGGAGRGRRAARSREPRHHRLGVPRLRPRARHRCVVGPRRHRERDRPVRRRLAHRHVLVALGVPHQRADRRSRRSRSRCVTCPSRVRTTNSRST